MKKTFKIDFLKRKHPKQWLLIEVAKMDEATTTPLAGHLIAHSPHRSEIYQKMTGIHNAKPLLVEYSEDKIPKGFAVAFYFNG